MPQPASACLGSIDRSFGPWAGTTCRGGFDFTLLFEETILTVPIHCIFLLILPARIFQLARSEIKVVPSLQRLFKASASICLCTLNVVLLCLWTTTDSSTITHTRATVPTASLAFIASLGYCLLSWLEHQRDVRPSFILTVYLFLSVLLDIARARTLWMLGSSVSLPAIFACTLALRVMMLGLESTEKRGILVPYYQGLSKEVTGSTLSRSIFSWLTSLFMNGYKRILTPEDLYPLDPKLQSEGLHKDFTEAWGKVPDQKVPNVLFTTWLRAFAGPMMAPVIPKLFCIAFNYTQPFLITTAITLAASPQIQPFNNFGYGLIGAYIIVYIGKGVSTGQYEHRLYRAATMMRGSVIGLVYQKSLHLDLNSSDVSPKGALTLISTDSETVLQGIVHLHQLWGGIVEIGIGIYLLYRQLGPACAMPIAFAFAMLISTGIFGIPTGKAHAAWVAASQERVSKTSDTLSSIKWLKASGLNDIAFSMIREMRTKELEKSMKFRMLMGLTLIMFISSPIWSGILTICVFVGGVASGNNTLTISKAFTSYSILVLVNRPLGDIILAFPFVASSLTSFQRIQNHLNAKVRYDNRESSGNKNYKGDKDIQLQQSDRSTSQDMQEMRDENGDYLSTPDKTSTSFPDLDDEFIASVQGTFSWKEESNPVIDISDWKLRRQTLTLVLGPVGCGKSTLLKSLLGELSPFGGTVRTNYNGVAYCSQNPWLPNEPIRSIIVGPAEFDQAWYNTVTKACALEQDLQEWPNGNDTMAGSMGISMSGGQKHRIAIARALYSRRELLILDDVFSGLDSTTENTVFNNLLSQKGLLRTEHRTIVIASSDGMYLFHRIPFADQIIVLDAQGRIKNTGTPGEVKHDLRFAEDERGLTSQPEKESFQKQKAVGSSLETILATKKIEADSTRRLGDWSMYRFYAQAVGGIVLTSFLIAMFIFAFCSAFPQLWMKWWAEANEKHPNSDLGKWVGVFVTLGAGANISILFGMWLLFIVAINRSGIHFHSMMLDVASRAPISFHSSVDSGVTVNRFSQDLQLIDMELPAAASGVIVTVMYLLAEFVMISIASKYLAAILPFLIPAFYALQHFYLRTSRQMRLLDIEQKAPLYTQLIETLDGLATIRAFQWEDQYEHKFLSHLDDSQKPSYLLYCLQRWLTFATDMLVAAVAITLIVITVTLREQIGPGYMGIALSNILAFSDMVKATLTSWVMLETALGAVARVKNFVHDTEVEGADEGELTEPEDKNWPSQGAVEFRGVTASYP